MSSGYGFRADRIVPDGRGALVWDPLRDAIVELSDDGSMQPARHLPAHPRRWTVAAGLLWCADDEFVEVRRLDGVLCEHWDLPTPPVPTTSPWCFGGLALAHGRDETLWTLRPGEAPAPVGRVTGIPIHCDGEHAWMRTGQTVDVVDIATGSLVSRRDVGGPFSYPRIHVGDGSLFVEYPPTRRGDPERIGELDARSLEPVGDIELVRGWTALAVIDATAIIVPRRALRSEREWRVAPNLFWIDARTGDGIGASSVEHEPSVWSAVRGADCAWAFAAPRSGGPGWTPVRVPSRPGVVHGWTLEDADVSALHPLVAPADAAAVEARALADLSSELASGWRDTRAGEVMPFIDGVTFTDFRLERSWPDTVVAAEFSAEQRPGVRFVRRFRIWAADGSPDDLTTDAINLMEDVVACGYGLPTDPTPGTDGLVEF